MIGKVAAQFRVTSESHCFALQMAAGMGRLTQVIVSDSSVASALIKGKVLQYRVTFLPLAQIGRIPNDF